MNDDPTWAAPTSNNNPTLRTYGKIDVVGDIVRCDVTLNQKVKPNATVRLAYDGEDWVLATTVGRLALLKLIGGAEVARVQVLSTTTQERPGWATFLGIVGLFVLLIGIVFFFVKQTVPASLVELTLTTGEVVAVAVKGDPAPLRVCLGVS